MGKIYKNQSLLKIILNYKQSIGEVIEARIRFKDPDGKEGYFEAFHNESNKTFEYELKPNEFLDKSGTWTFWNEAIIVSGHIVQGEPSRLNVFNPGE